MDMTDSPLSPPTEVHPPGPGFFQNPGPGFVLLRVFLYLIVAEVFTEGIFFLYQGLGLASRWGQLPETLMASEVVRLASVVAAAWIMARLEKRNWGEYGLPWRRGESRYFLHGVAFGFVEMSAVIGILAWLGYYHFGAIVIHGVEFFRWIGFWAVFFVAVGFFEEFAFRGYTQFALTQGFGFWPASLATSFVFAAVHLSNPGESWPGIAGVFVTGMFWCFTLQRTGSLWFAVGMHAAFDFCETFVYSVPDSGMIFPGHLSSATLGGGPAWLVGGTAGPEASVLDFAVLALFFYVVHRLYPAKKTAAGVSETGENAPAAALEDKADPSLRS